MIEVVNLTKRFLGAREVLAVDRLSFSVAAGEVYGLLGPNGAGKTTTLRMMLGLVEPTDGYAEVAGYRTSEASDEVKRRVGLVSAGAGLYPWLSPREMLLFFADIYGIAPPLASERLEKFSEIFGLMEFLDQRCATLSTGQKQRINMVRALIHDPPIMLLDEPTQGLDVLGSKVFCDYVNHLRELGKAVVLSTHRLDEAERLCDRFGLMHRGSLAAEGSFEHLKALTERESLVDMFLQLADQTEPAEPPA